MGKEKRSWKSGFVYKAWRRSKTYFDRGLITESEYNSAKVNKENYQVQCLIDDIEMIIYNNDTKLLFTRDSELYKDKENVNGSEKNEDK